jgi:glycosyltransferase involved in cell wall biosynthesis
MKIALVTETYPPEVNGVAMTLERLVRGLTARGNAVEVVRPRQSSADAAHAEGLVTERLCMGVPLPGYAGLHFGLIYPGFLARHWEKSPPDLVHVATEGPLGWAAVRAARKLRIPVVSSYHTNFHSYGTHYGYGALVRTALAWLRHLHNRTLLTFAPSPDVAARLSSEGFKNVRLMGRGVDTVLFSPARRSDEERKRWGALPETPVVLYVGRIAGEKNMPLTIEAMLAMRRVLPDMKIVLVGDGPLRAKLEKEHPEFIFTGTRRGENLALHYACGDIFIFASETETFGNVVTEAMASGLPVLAFDYAAPARYLRDTRAGVLAPLGDASGFVLRATELAARRGEWAAMGAEARRIATGISWDAVVDSYLRDATDAVEAREC